MARKACPSPNPDCPYFDRPPMRHLAATQEHGCFSDLDHIVPRRLGTTALAVEYIALPENKQQLCRREHEIKTLSETDELPPVEVMRDAVMRAYVLGQIALSIRKRKRLGL